MQILALLDDLEGHVVHGQLPFCVALQPLLRQCQILCVEVIHLPKQVLIPGVQLCRHLWGNHHQCRLLVHERLLGGSSPIPSQIN